MDETFRALQAKWDTRYRANPALPSPIPVLADNVHLLPHQGTALDLACGLGANALLLARRGLQTTACDASAEAIARLRDASAQLPLHAQVCDLAQERLPSAGYDVICVGHFLDRELCPAIAAALRPGGLLYYQTFTTETVDGTGPSDGRFRLRPNELLHLFPGLLVRFYREEGLLGDTALGVRGLAQMVAQRAD
jgi:SAM-dependent methyltransferase